MPFAPGIDKSLCKVFKKAGCELAFKAPRNLGSILTAMNKPQLPPNKKLVSTSPQLNASEDTQEKPEN